MTTRPGGVTKRDTFDIGDLKSANHEGVPFSNASEARKVYTVAELTRSIRFTLEDRFSNVWVEGEISNFLHHRSGHMYFSLKDSESTLSCVMFRQDNLRVRFEPKDGLKVLCRGRVSVYAPRGSYQLVLEELQPKGLGALQLAFEQLKAKLEKEGLFDEGRKRPLPVLPACIGVVTSPDGAVIRDMIRIWERRFPGFSVLIAPVQVQGDSAKSQIAQAIRDLNADGRVDVIVLARGGGSTEDLWPFNEELVARAIVASSAPVVSAIGHEVDYTIADFVADLRAPTPSAAAEMLLPEKAELVAAIDDCNKRLKRALVNFSRDRMQRVDEAAKALRNSFMNTVKFARERFKTAVSRLETLSPLACLARGYSITFDEKGGTVKSVKNLSVGGRVRTRTADGSFTGRIEEISHGE